MKKILLAILICISSSAFSQIVWYPNLESAKKMASVSNKWILVDLWATWCGPCLKMDREVWNQQEVLEAMDNFIAVRIDVDVNRTDFTTLGGKVMPTMMIIDLENSQYYRVEGYTNAVTLVNKLKAFNTSPQHLYDHQSKILREGESFELLMMKGDALLQMSTDTENRVLKGDFLANAKASFKNAQKAAKKYPIKVEEAELYEKLVYTYMGKPDKTIKELDKMSASLSGENSALLNYAYCMAYSNKEDQESADSFEKKLRDCEGSSEFITKLEKK